MATIRVKIKDERRAYFFITEYDIKKDYLTNVIIESLPKPSAERFLNALLLDILDAEQRQDAIDDLSDYVYGVNDGGTGPVGDTESGHVSIYDITPSGTGNVGLKVLSNEGNRLETAASSTDEIRVHVKALTGPSNYKPNVIVEGVAATMSEDPGHPMIWFGYSDIQLPLDGIIMAVHEDGAEDTANVVLAAAPQIVSAVFTGGYPGAQTELKEDDTFQLYVTSDVPMARISVSDIGACKPDIFDFPAAHRQYVTVRIANRGDVATLRSATIMAHNAPGAGGALFNTSSAGSTDGVHEVMCSDLHPTVSYDSVSYPASQGALKDNETAYIGMSFQHADSAVFSSPNGQLQIEDASTLDVTKTISRVSGGYNVTTDNLRCSAVRLANMAIATEYGVVNIAHDAPEISLGLLPRLRSGGNAGTMIQAYTISLLSSQLLANPPEMDEYPSAGVFIDSWSGVGTTFTRTMHVEDSHGKGVFEFQNFNATGLSGLPAVLSVGSLNYELSGFVKRRVYFPPLEYEASMGVSVSDTSRLMAADKDLIAMSYQGSLNNGSRRFSITGPSGVSNPNGNIVFWADETEVHSNTTGLSFIEIEEV